MRVLDSEGIVDPDGQARSTGDTQEGGVPNVTGFTYIAGYRNWPAVMTGAFSATVHGTSTALGPDQGVLDLTLDASKVSSVYQNDLTEVRPSNISVRLIIKAYAEAVSELTLEELYPVGSFYISAVDSEICPIEALGCGRWVKIEAGHFLQQAASGESVGKLIEAGLPDITGEVGYDNLTFCNTINTSGAFAGTKSTTYSFSQTSTTNSNFRARAALSAARSNAIYGKSDTVQPPALAVNIWQRVLPPPELVLVCDIPSDNYQIDLGQWLSAAPGDGTTNISINWGDGSADESYQVSETQRKDTILHTFTTAGKYRITLNGLFNWGAGKHISDTSLQATLTAIELPSGNSPIKHVSTYTFYKCIALTSIPAGLFDKCTTVKNFDNCFYGCITLISIPEGLFDNCTEVISFYGCFNGCITLISIPHGLFDNCTKATQFWGCFYNCSNITSVLPTLWISHSFSDGGLCFYNCTKATNYAEAKAAGWA